MIPFWRRNTEGDYETRVEVDVIASTGEIYVETFMADFDNGVASILPSAARRLAHDLLAAAMESERQQGKR